MSALLLTVFSVFNKVSSTKKIFYFVKKMEGRKKGKLGKEETEESEKGKKGGKKGQREKRNKEGRQAGRNKGRRKDSLHSIPTITT